MWCVYLQSVEVGVHLLGLQLVHLHACSKRERGAVSYIMGDKERGR